jgi:hypothetical protein
VITACIELFLGDAGAVLFLKKGAVFQSHFVYFLHFLEFGLFELEFGREILLLYKPLLQERDNFFLE